MNDARHGFEVFLRPGEWYVGDEEVRIRTLLGSCVSVAMWHPKMRIGGMCHYMLAQRKSHELPGVLSGRYADEAVLLLLQSLLRYGCAIREFQVKLVGGASVLSSLEREMQLMDVPAENVAAARRLARQLGLNVLAEDLGGNSARLVVFDLASGDVWVRQNSERDALASAAGLAKREMR